MPFTTDGPFGKPLDGIAQTFKELRAKHAAEEQAELEAENIEISAEKIDEAKVIGKYSPNRADDSFKGDAYELRDHGSWHSIIKTHQDGKSTQNEHGGYSTAHLGDPKYVAKKWKNLQSHYNDPKVTQFGRGLKKEEAINEISTEKLKSYVGKRIANKDTVGYGKPFADKDYGSEKQRLRSNSVGNAEQIIRDRGNPITKPKVHDLSHMSHGDAYDHTQTSGHIKDGDVLKVKGGGAAVMMKAWPTMVHGETDGRSLHQLKPGNNWNTFEKGRYAKSAQVAHSLKAPVKEEAEPEQPSFKQRILDHVKKKKEAKVK